MIWQRLAKRVYSILFFREGNSQIVQKPISIYFQAQVECLCFLFYFLLVLMRVKIRLLKGWNTCVFCFHSILTDHTLKQSRCRKTDSGQS